MEDWRKAAVAEIEKLLELLFQDDFRPKDLSDRLQSILEFAELGLTEEPYQEDSD